ncbi:hypothetical protein [Ktedonospora formicarum]|uniref:Uncharacterized protein n=1 Tax=Ktedonospora formicarum TaxID=2778364 RepID=A0A8J3I8Q2_9CHLR|nr:hypothetical protein [Ktedonospora formicarum]GHO47479.1 hypothetical protein KSX_56420 [Ktedonospora formicarum]
MRLRGCAFIVLFGLLLLLMGGLSLGAVGGCPSFVGCKYTPKASLVVEGHTYYVASTESWNDSLIQEDFYLYQCDPFGWWCHQVEKVGSVLPDAVSKYPYPTSKVFLQVIHHYLVIECKYGSASIKYEYPLSS